MNQGAGDSEPIALSELTTMRVGGVPARMVAPATEQELVDAAPIVSSVVDFRTLVRVQAA